MSVFPPTDRDLSATTLERFARRYAEPLRTYARRSLGASPDDADELVQAFFLRELQRSARVVHRYEASRGHGGRFRTFLGVCFRNFCRDRWRSSRRLRELASLERLEQEPGALDPALERLLLRDWLNALRARVVDRGELSSRDLAYLALKWPRPLDRDSASDAEIARALDLSRGQVRASKARVLGSILAAAAAAMRAEGLSLSESDAFLRDWWDVLARGEGTAGRGR